MKKCLFMLVMILSIIAIATVSVSNCSVYAKESDKSLISIKDYIDQDTKLNSLAYGDNMFVAVGKNGLIRISRDGLNWTHSYSGTNVELYKVIWAKGKYIVVGEMGTILSSVDGEKWTKAYSATDSTLTGVRWVGNKFIVNGQENIILTSEDGLIWVPSEIPYVQYLLRAAWNGKKYISADRGMKILASTDGLEWQSLQQVENNNSLRIEWIVWNGSKFLAVGVKYRTKGDLAQTIVSMVSDDGITWKVGNHTEIEAPVNVMWNGSQFIIISSKGGILASEDGINWSKLVPDYVGFDHASITDVVWGLGKYVCIIDNKQLIASEDCISWMTYLPSREGLVDIIQKGSRKVASGYIFGSQRKILTSEDGRVWTYRIPQSFNSISSIAWDGNRFVAVASNKSVWQSVLDRSEKKIIVSEDGKIWTQVPYELTENINSIIWADKQFIGVGENGVVIKSSDGIKWAKLDSNIRDTFTDVAWNGYRLVAVGNKGAIWTSADASNWTPAISGVNKNLTGVAWDNEKLIIVGEKGTILTSENGFVWEQRDAGTFEDIKSVSKDGEYIVSTSYNNLKPRLSIFTEVPGIIKINDEYQSIKPLVINGDIYIPVVETFRELGYKVEPYVNDKIIKVFKDKFVCELYLDKNYVKVNGKRVQLKESVRVRNETAVLLLEDALRINGLTAEWDKANKSINIYESK